MKRLTWASLLITLLCGTFGSAFALVTPNWSEIDVNKDGVTEWVAKTNAADLAFNQKGELVGWYVKFVKGTEYGSDYSKATNLMAAPSGVLTFGTATAKDAEFKAAKPKTFIENNGDRVASLSAVFEYRVGNAQVRKTVKFLTYRLTLDYGLTIKGVADSKLTWTGLSQTPEVKIMTVGGSAPLQAGEVKALQYASFQCCNNALGNPGEALIIQPAPNQTAFVARAEPAQVSVKDPNGQQLLNRGKIEITLPANQTSSFKIYGGQNELVRLDLEGMADLPGLFQANWLGNLSRFLLRVLEWLRNTTGGWGLAIIALTVLLRLLLWPLLQAQFRSTAEMQVIQPLVNALNEKHKDDPQAKQVALMQLYQEHKVNPLAGCFPVLLQMPVLLVLWRVISNYEFDQGFLWLKDLALPDTWPNGFFILPVLYVLVNIAQLYVSTRNNPEMFRQQLIISLAFAFIVLQLPSGVTLYSVLSTVLGLAQQIWITSQINARKGIVAPVAASKTVTIAKTSPPAPSNGKSVAKVEVLPPAKKPDAGKR
jgi:YidC/Oxa1 family membrane protein insertase